MKEIHARIVRARQVAEGIGELVLRDESLFARPVTPGQFLHLALTDGARLLRRPISIYDADEQIKEITLVIQQVGEGTRQLLEREPGECISVLGPVGNGFHADGARSVYAVGGGVGVAPVRFAMKQWAKSLSLEGFFGFRSGAHVYGVEGLNAPVHLATEDGSAGVRGLVTQPLRERMMAARPDLVVCCGPKPMMRAVKQLCEELKVPCQLSMEERMGCGVGGCYTCTCKVKQDGQWHYRRVCVDGPVFDAAEVAFDE